jgi:hypothetical protein
MSVKSSVGQWLLSTAHASGACGQKTAAHTGLIRACEHDTHHLELSKHTTAHTASARHRTQSMQAPLTNCCLQVLTAQHVSCHNCTN